ncbi:tetratricopeptide repeat protein [Acrocarpospora sp. B8E8]|uniref:tetratricopeptide repeat protein n=1 Tax=Acrocarpospora sp. B8E8 TaxID=3153572 RepID=UPI00325CCD3B
MDGESLAAVRARLAKFERTGDPSRLFKRKAWTEALHLLESVSSLEKEWEAAHAVGWLSWQRYRFLPEGEDAEALEMALNMLEWAYRHDPGSVPDAVREHFRKGEVGEDTRWRWLGDANALSTEFQRSQDLDLLEEAIVLYRRAVDELPPVHDHYAPFLSNLGAALRTRSEAVGDQASLHEALRVSRQALEAPSSLEDDRARQLCNLGRVLNVLARRAGKLAYLLEAVDVGRRAVTAAPADHPDRPAYVSVLAGSLNLLYLHNNDVAVLAEALELSREAFDATPPGHVDYELRKEHHANLREEYQAVAGGK